MSNVTTIMTGMPAEEWTSVEPFSTSAPETGGCSRALRRGSV
jgi:hypothetical protein